VAQRMKVQMRFHPEHIMYLVIVDKMLKKWANVMKVRPTDKFFDMVHGHVVDHAVRGVEPPKQIAAAILNIADDMMSGRDVVLRAGDYISLMDYARKTRKL